MHTGAITNHIDVAQLALYAFWLFFAGLILYLRREDKREGFPMAAERGDGRIGQGFPNIPAPKLFHLADGTVVMAPRVEPAQPPLAAVPTAPWPGAPLEPTGNPLVDGVGPAAWVARADHPDRLPDGANKIVPMRKDGDLTVETRDPDPAASP